MDYYDPHPRIRLEEHVVLAGQVGSGVASIGRAMAARTGLPFAEVDRMVEHTLGSSMARIVGEQGAASLRGHCSEALRRALARQVRGFVVLGSGGLEPQDLEAVRAETRFVYVRRPAAVLLRRIQSQLARSPGSLFQFALGVPRSPQELAPLLAGREKALLGAHVILEAGDRDAREIADDLLSSLDRITGVESL